MSYSLSSARRMAAGAVGASAVAGALLFGAAPAANAAPAAMGPAHVATAPAFIAPQPAWWGHHHFWGHHHRGWFFHHHRGIFHRSTTFGGHDWTLTPAHPGDTLVLWGTGGGADDIASAP